ncbi:MBL fold metallo-hydrolase [Belnapia rosea]|uniref:L-ascorbate metabolism protein UlaG, beta-lactamase superfamily n=1 Tax=Belnapia rosea TaxID=938405 RepID=A0A1G6U615_9PROT|nr:MBL fold metallo-hydrolase [Belnapia rosea]SDD36126.1 L-ascorbate metabolism protein UlaG, beta-lactamase superfamily [Belnapia rosea]
MQIAPSDHWDGRHFHNVHDRTEKTFRDVWRWRRTSRAIPWPPSVEDAPQPAPRRLPAGRIGATFIGHASFLIQLGGRCILVDPVWSERASPLTFAGPRRVRAPGQRLEDLPGCDLLLVSHNHYDHLDLPTLREVRRRWSPPAITGLANARHLAKAGIQAATELDWWQSTEMAGLRITYVPAQHFSARTLFDRNCSLWGGFVIQSGDATVYFAGDSGWCPHFAEIAARFPRIDLALLPIGAYEPRFFMRTQHMDPGEAVEAHRALGARRSIGMHFGTFAGLTDEAIEGPEAWLAEARAAAGLAEEAFTTLPFGASLDLAETPR